MDEIAAALLGDLRGAPEQGAAAAGDLDQLDAQRLQLLVLGASDALGHDADHAEAERLGGDRRAQGGVAHRRHHELRPLALVRQLGQQVSRAANLEAARRRQKLALGVDRVGRKEVPEADQRRRRQRDHGCRYSPADAPRKLNMN